MSERINIGQKVKALDVAPQFSKYSKVVLNVTNELHYVAGDSTGRTLTVECPWGTQTVADNILASIKGYAYQPFTATGALVDASAELGDVIEVDGVASRIYSQNTTFGALMFSDVSAPEDEEVDHEFPYEPKQERKVRRQFANVQATLAIQADAIQAEVEQRESDVEVLIALFEIQSDQISAKVSQTGGNSQSFGWNLTSSSWVIQSSGSEVLKATADGLEVTGKVTATSGYIGGFDIGDNAITYNEMTWDNPSDTGVYFGPLGLKLGKKFSVDSQGNLVAASGTFSGSVSASQIIYGEGNTLSGAALTSNSVAGSKLSYGTITTDYTSTGINTSLGYADYSNDVFAGIEIVNDLIARQFASDQVSTDQLLLGGVELYTTTMSDGSGALRNVVSWRARTNAET